MRLTHFYFKNDSNVSMMMELMTCMALMKMVTSMHWNVILLKVKFISTSPGKSPLLEKLHWLPISERIKYKVACMCFSAINSSGPAYLSEQLNVYTPFRILRSSSDTRMLKIQQYKRKTHGFRTFSFLDPTFGIHSLRP